MSTPDFSKIWGSNVSPENRYKFTDSAYLEGWSYIGSVPPAREAFDTLFRDIDTKMSYLNDELKNQSDSAKEHDANAAAHNAMATTVDDTLVPTSDTNTIRNLVSNLANRIKAATGAGGWKEAPAATLASLSKMFANLATGADVTWDGKKFTNHRLGITGLMDQNGYICFGPNCGNLIIQWGNYTGTNRYATYPIAFNTMNQLTAIATGCNIDIDTCDLTWFAFHIRKPGEAAIDISTSTTIHWISVGY